jgi:hypothetical protein
MTNDAEWIEVVQPTDLDQGQNAFVAWLEEHGIVQEQIPPDDIRVDVIRVKEGSRMRYLVRQETLKQLGVAH